MVLFEELNLPEALRISEYEGNERLELLTNSPHEIALVTVPGNTWYSVYRAGIRTNNKRVFHRRRFLAEVFGTALGCDGREFVLVYATNRSLNEQNFPVFNNNFCTIELSDIIGYRRIEDASALDF